LHSWQELRRELLGKSIRKAGYYLRPEGSRELPNKVTAYVCE
jgi:hypothetical protein